MGKRMNGPDWTDVALHLSAIGALHGCRVAIHLIADTEGHNGSLDMSVSALFELLPNSEEQREVVTKGRWPTMTGETVPGKLLGLLVELDWEISKKYKHGEMFSEL